MILKNASERFHYMSGYFGDVCEHPEKYPKSDLIRYFKILGKLFDSPDEDLDTNNGGF